MLLLLQVVVHPPLCCQAGMLDDYFYVQDLNTNNNDVVRHYVQEHLATSGTTPGFLYDPHYPNGRVVEFYASWCPHCQHFKPKYMEFSIKLHQMAAKMNNNVKVETFAVSCVPNKPICKDQHIKGYPTTKFYPPYSLNGTDVSPFSLHPQDIMRKAMMGEAASPSGVVVPPQQEDSDNSQQPKKSAAAAGANHKAATTTTGDNDKNNNKSRVRGGHHHHPRGDVVDQSLVAMEEVAATGQKKKSLHFLRRSREEAFRDAHLSFGFAMKTAIYTSDGPLPEEKQNVLKAFLRILQKTLPVTMTVQPLLNDLVKNFDTLTEGDDQLSAILERHPAPFEKWSESSTLHGTGYTAGLWTLFHIMSVGLVEWNQMAMDDSQLLVPSEVADHLRSYIEHFFLCDVCRLNFMNEYDACSYDRCNRLISKRKGTLEQYIQFPLWLLETHNAVNTRLRKERIELHDEPEKLTTEYDVMWPPVDWCPSCWKAGGGHWDELAMFKFLHASYWPELDTEVVRSLQDEDTDTSRKLQQAASREEPIQEGNRKLKVLFALLLFSAAMMVLWQRKRQFLRKGYHKKV